jgi:tetratricopeptide (TPR) repeat protein
MNLGAMYFKNKEVEEGKKAFIKAIEIKENHSEARMTLVQYLMTHQLYDEAFEHIEAEIRLNPTNVDPWTFKGVIGELKSDYEKAEEAYLQAEKLDKENVQVLNNLGSINFNFKQDNETAQAYYERAIKCDPSYPYPWANLIRLYFKTGDNKVAEETYDNAITQNKYNQEFMVSVAKIVIQEAPPEFGEVLKTTVENAHSFEFFLTKYGITNPHKKVNPTTFRKELELMSQGAKAYNNGSYELALQQYKQVLEINPKNFIAKSLIGESLNALDKFEEAKSHLQEALTIESNFYVANIHMGVAEAHLNNIEKAIEHYQRAISVVSEDPTPYVNLGIAHTKLKKHEKALGYYEKAVELGDDGLTTYVRIALTYQQLDQAEKAKDILKPFPSSQIIEFVKTSTLRAFQREDYHSTVQYGELVVLLDPDDRESWDALEKSYTILGNEAEAQRCKKKHQSLAKQS